MRERKKVWLVIKTGSGLNFTVVMYQVLLYMMINCLSLQDRVFFTEKTTKCTKSETYRLLLLW